MKDYGFERIKDPLAAFQEISMYLANILVEQKEFSLLTTNIESNSMDLI